MFKKRSVDAVQFRKCGEILTLHHLQVHPSPKYIILIASLSVRCCSGVHGFIALQIAAPAGPFGRNARLFWWCLHPYNILFCWWQ